ncbi:hypothetical protein [Pontiella sulfatireligans]|uniref:hypothetical protein n=1 Tax=Pontiella sulfatireligans TaxID=2750658 RepID=UPI00109CB526|nr:hypothetical protein [Pontiella sulfatireligans]
MLYRFVGAEADDLVITEFQQLLDIVGTPRSGLDFNGNAFPVLFGMQVYALLLPMGFSSSTVQPSCSNFRWISLSQ